MTPRTHPIAVGPGLIDDFIEVLPLAHDGSARSAKLDSKSAVDWICLAPEGTLLSPNIVQILIRSVLQRPTAEIFYSDDFSATSTSHLRLKPDFDLTLLTSQDYIGAPLILRRSLFARLGLRKHFGTATIADLLFRANSAGVPITRITEVLLYHTKDRVTANKADYAAMLASQPGNGACDFDLTPEGSFVARRRFTDPHRVTIIIPTCRTLIPGRTVSYIERLLDALVDTDWPLSRLHVLVGDDGRGNPSWDQHHWPFKLERISTQRLESSPFNYSAKMNGLLRHAPDEQIVFMNDDVLPVNKGWLRALQTFSVQNDVGGVGACLRFEDGRLQHAGMAPGRTAFVHAWFGRAGASGTYQNWALSPREWSAVTGAVFATRRSLMERVGGFDERFSLEFNDTDLCLRLRSYGYRIVYNPDASFLHAEKASRGSGAPPGEDVARFFQRWRPWLKDDPSWHPLLRMEGDEVIPLRDTPT